MMTTSAAGRIGRAALVAASAALAAVAALPAGAQEWKPTRPIKIVVPFPAGGPTDVLARIYGNRLGERLGQQVITENRPGASGIPAAMAVAQSSPDGTTFLFGSSTFHVILPIINKSLSYDPDKDFATIGMIARIPLILVTDPHLPATDLKSLIAMLKAKPGGYNFGSSGIGTPAHLSGERLKQLAGVDVVHVPYRGSGSSVGEMSTDKIAFRFEGALTSLTQAKAGRVRAIGVGLDERLAGAPDLPTLSESGLPGFESYSWNALYAPAGTPKPIIDRMSRELNEIGKEPDTVARLRDLGIAPVTNSTPESLTAFAHEEAAKWKPIIEKANIPIK